jgi:hypothetical protein
MLLVPAGKIVDAVINDLLPHLEKGDIDYRRRQLAFSDTERAKLYLPKRESNLSASAFPAAKKARVTARALCPAEGAKFTNTSPDSRSRQRESRRRAVRRLYGKVRAPGISSKWFTTASNTA